MRFAISSEGEGVADTDALDAHARARDERRRLAREVERIALPRRLEEVEVAAPRGAVLVQHLHHALHLHLLLDLGADGRREARPDVPRQGEAQDRAGLALDESGEGLLPLGGQAHKLGRRRAGGDWLEMRSVRLALDKLLRREAGARELARLLTLREIEIVRMVAGGLRNKEI